MRLRSTVSLAGFLALALSSAATAADIVDTAIAGKFNTLVAAVKAAGPGRYLERSRPVHGVRTHRRSLREVTRRRTRRSAETGKQGQAAERAHLSRSPR